MCMFVCVQKLVTCEAFSKFKPLLICQCVCVGGGGGVSVCVLCVSVCMRIAEARHESWKQAI